MVYNLMFYTFRFLSLVYHEELQTDQKDCTGHLVTFVNEPPAQLAREQSLLLFNYFFFHELHNCGVDKMMEELRE